MAERSIAAVLKTVKPKGFGGSNPSVSANLQAEPASLEQSGEMPEWSIGAVSKTVERSAFQGFESLSLRKQGCKSTSYVIYTLCYFIWLTKKCLSVIIDYTPRDSLTIKQLKHFIFHERQTLHIFPPIPLNFSMKAAILWKTFCFFVK